MGEDSSLDPRGTKILTSSAQGKKYGEERIKANINMTALKHEVCFPFLSTTSALTMGLDVS
jgi:hypothetical protein